MDALHRWAPSAAVFRRRALLLGLMTFLATFALVMLWRPDPALFLPVGLGLPLVITLVFFIEDAMRWRALRTERWEVDAGHLIHDGSDGRAMIPLSQLKSAHTRLGNVVVTLTSGRRIMMRYLATPAEVTKTLNTLRPS